MDDIEIINKFLEVNLNVHPDVIDGLKAHEKVEEYIEKIISKVMGRESKPSVITLDFIESLEAVEVKAKKDNGEDEIEDKGRKIEDGLGTDLSTEIKDNTEIKALRPKRYFLAQEYEPVLIIDDERDITNKSFSTGDIEGFVECFNDRFERVSRILRERDHLRDAATIEWVRNNALRENTRIIGIVNDIRKSKKGHIILELEDPTGVIPILILNTNRELLSISENILKDEVIGVEGNVGRDNDIIIARDIFFPDVPIKREIGRSSDPLALAMISDSHLGSTEFLEREFLKFIKWLNGDVGNEKQRNLAEKVKYLTICGDLVDGVGIYPGQENELLIKDIREQYSKFSDFIEMVPEHIEILIIPGNHDATRQAEPQPAIMEEFAPRLYQDDRIHMAGNPCYANIHGVKTLVYHGRSLDDLVSTLPQCSYSQPEKPMLELLKKRHLAPVYGGKVPLSPEVRDYMLIEEVPDLVHFGHVHTVGVTNYRGAILINSGTFQNQTSFQRRLNMRPDPARIPIIDLQTHKTTLMKFL